MAPIRIFRQILQQAEPYTDPERNLRFFERLERENLPLPFEPWSECFKRPAFAPSEIVPGLYLSNIKTAAHFLLGHDTEDFPVSHMLSIMEIGSTVSWRLPEAQGPGKSIKRLTLNRRDTQTENILRDFDRTSDFIHEAIQLYKSSEMKSGGILVHCFAGISRSASLVIAYLLKHPESLPPAARTMMDDVLHDTANFVKSRRELIRPNRGFRKQLSFYYDVLNCTLTDEQTKRTKEPYRRWVQQRACNNAKDVVLIIKQLAAERQMCDEDHFMQFPDDSISTAHN